MASARLGVKPISNTSSFLVFIFSPYRLNPMLSIMKMEQKN
jgi:hypothetical protein